jgi:hypothetical protein
VPSASSRRWHPPVTCAKLGQIPSVSAMGQGPICCLVPGVSSLRVALQRVARPAARKESDALGFQTSVWAATVPQKGTLASSKSPCEARKTWT